MSYAADYSRSQAAGYAIPSERAAFIRRTYTHLAGAILAFTLIEAAIFNLVPKEQLQARIGGFFAMPMSQLILFAAFIGVGWVARMWAYSSTSEATQYLGLALYVVFEALFFVPILFIAIHYSQDKFLLQRAAIMTLCMFGGLTAAVLITRKDFSFLGSILSIGGFLMLGLILSAVLFGVNLGLWFAFLAVALACGYILYDTSNVLYHFRTTQHVAASLELFASIAYLFYYILYILLMNSRRD